MTRQPGAAPQRTCVVCRATADKRSLHRIVRGPDGTVSYDPTGKAAGRGAYLCGQPACLELARKRRAVQRALRTAGAAGADAAVEALGRALSSAGSTGLGAAGQRPRSSMHKEVRTG